MKSFNVLCVLVFISIALAAAQKLGTTDGTVADSEIPLGTQSTIVPNESVFDVNIRDLELVAVVTYILKFVWNGFYMFGTIPQYYPQYQEIKNGRGESFSPLICFILLTSNIIRIFYWLGEPFDTVLLVQSFVMVFVQLNMLHIMCFAKVQKATQADYISSAAPAKKSKSIFDFNLSEFWQWDDFFSYLSYAVMLTSVLSVSCFLFLTHPIFVQFLGYFGLLVEAMLAVPQIHHNVTKGTVGLQPFLFWTWLLGDIAKTVFFVLLNAPLPFALCGTFQILTDAVILLQIFNDSRKSKVKNSNLPPQ